MKKKRERFPNTKFQHWLAKNYACKEARRAVGRKSLQEAWATTRSSAWMIWFLFRRHPNSPGNYGWGCDGWRRYVGVVWNSNKTKVIRERVDSSYIRLED